MSEASDRSISQKVREALREGGLRRVIVMAWARALHPLVRWLDRTVAARWNPAIVCAARLRGLPVVHVVGDSHTLVLAGVFPFRVTWMGAATAYNLDKAGSTTGSREKLARALRHVRSKDVVLLILGEVDSRIHIFDQFVKRGGADTTEELIRRTIDRYGVVILKLKSEGYRVVVHSVPATPYQDNIFEVENYADEETRARIVAEFNLQLSDWCAANTIEYFDMYSLVSDERGFIRRELTTDGTHLDRSALPIYRHWVQCNASPGRTK